MVLLQQPTCSTAFLRDKLTVGEATAYKTAQVEERNRPVAATRRSIAIEHAEPCKMRVCVSQPPPPPPSCPPARAAPPCIGSSESEDTCRSLSATDLPGLPLPRQRKSVYSLQPSVGWHRTLHALPGGHHAPWLRQQVATECRGPSGLGDLPVDV